MTTAVDDLIDPCGTEDASRSSATSLKVDLTTGSHSTRFSRLSRANSGASISIIQGERLTLIRSLVDEDLFRLEDLASESKEFSAWVSSVDESMERIRHVYVVNFDDQNAWPMRVRRTQADEPACGPGEVARQDRLGSLSRAITSGAGA